MFQGWTKSFASVEPFNSIIVKHFLVIGCDQQSHIVFLALGEPIFYWPAEVAGVAHEQLFWECKFVNINKWIFVNGEFSDEAGVDLSGFDVFLVVADGSVVLHVVEGVPHGRKVPRYNWPWKLFAIALLDVHAELDCSGERTFPQRLFNAFLNFIRFFVFSLFL